MDFLGYPLGWIMWALYSFINNYGLALIVFTLFTKIVLFPLAIKQQKGQAKTMVLQPKLEAIRKKFPNDRAKQQEATTALYQEEGVSPVSGCLPMLIQFPIMIGLMNVIYYPIKHLLHLSDPALNTAVETVRALGSASPEIKIISFLNGNMGMKPILSDEAIKAVHAIPANIQEQITSIDLNFFGLNLGQIPEMEWSIFILIPILSAISALLMSLISTKLTSRTMPQQGAGMMKGMMLIMPVMSFMIAFSVPVGVGIYWIASNFLNILQSYILYKIYTPEKMAEIVRLEKEKNKGKPKKPSLMQKMQGVPAPIVRTPEPETSDKSQKEINKQRLADARKRDAEKYGDTYVEDKD